MTVGKARADGQRFIRRHVDVRLVRDLIRNTKTHATRGLTLHDNNSHHNTIPEELHSVTDNFCAAALQHRVRTRASDERERFW
jgi:hypothetical protein